MTKTEKIIRDLIGSFSAIHLDRVDRGKHFKFFLTTPSGPRILTVAVSCSDGRALQNNRSLLKRWATRSET